MTVHDADMQYGGDAWRRLWHAMNDRRIELGMSWRTFYGAAGVSRETVVAMKEGQGIKNAHKLTGLDFACRWRRGSAQRVLEGQEPIVDAMRSSGPQRGPSTPQAEISATFDELVAAVESLDVRVSVIERQLGGSATGVGG